MEKQFWHARLFDLPVNYYSVFVFEKFDIENDAIFSDTLLVNNFAVILNKQDSTEKSFINNPKIKII